MKDKVKIILKSGKDKSVRRYHPWIFSGAIKKICGNPAEGDIVQIYDNKVTNVYRLIHAEGDDLPGLIIDYYNGVAVMQMHSVGMYRLREEFSKILQEVLGERLTAVYDKSEGTIPY